MHILHISVLQLIVIHHIFADNEISLTKIKSLNNLSYKNSRTDYSYFTAKTDEQLKNLIELLIEQSIEKSQCIVTMLDSYYRRKVDFRQLIVNNYLPIYRILIRDNEEFYPPRRRLIRILQESQYVGCNFYVILIANGLQVANLMQYTEEERLINAQAKFLLIHDYRIFHSELRYLWNRVVNVIFIRHHVEYKRNDDKLKKREWYDLETVPYPVRVKGLVVSRYVDTWYGNRFRYGTNHFAPKTSDLRRQKLRVAVFEHIPAVTEDAELYFKNQKDISIRSKPLGIEFEMLLIIANELNFKPIFYQPDDVQIERWGDMKNDTFTGLLGEAKKRNAVFYLGDLYYTMEHLQILDLSWPYNTECLTFLTLESLTENSWKLLVLPFRLFIWIALLLTLLFAGLTLYAIALFYKYHVGVKELPRRRVAKLVVDYKNFTILKNKKTIIDEWRGLHLFDDLMNSILYTYGMLLQVSLPTLPNAWSLRVFIGWWWLFTILISVTYKASMTASLANSVKRVTIDTLSELVKSSVAIGSWNYETRDFFLNSSDANLQKLGNRHVIVINEEDAIAAVSNGTLSYYESNHVLQRVRVERQIFEALTQNNDTVNDKRKLSDHNLHVMDECVVNVPISLGMDKHSPLKYRVDKLVKRIIEAGFVEKWLSDITQQSKILELRQEGNAQKALVDLDKLQGAVVALIFGYILSLMALMGEIWYWRRIVTRDPKFNRYRMDLFYRRY